MYVYGLNERRAGVLVKKIPGRSRIYQIVDKEEVKEHIATIPAGTRVFRFDSLPNAKIIAQDGTECEPIGFFLITAETIDPYHWVIDYFDTGGT